MMDTSDSEAVIPEHKDYYADHLAQVNESSNQVLASDDIYNSQGILLLRKGAQLDNKFSSQITKHKLLKPIEQNIELENSLNGKIILERFHALLDAYPDLKKLHESHEFENVISGFLLGKQLHPILTQKLTIMAEQLPDQLTDGIFSAWLSALVAHQMQMNQHEVYDAFLTGLIHDIGMIHLDPEVILSKSKLEEEGVKVFQSHVVVGSVILHDIAGVPESISRAVLEHHERCDGSGYPHGRLGRKISKAGKILGIVDAILTLRVENFQAQGRHIGDALLYLKLNESTFSSEVFRAMYSVISKANLAVTERNPYDSIKDYATQLKIQSESMLSLMPNLMLLLTHMWDIEKVFSNNTIKAVISQTSRIINTLKRSGLLFDEQIEWLDELINAPSNEVLLELNNIDYMLEETIRQLKNNHYHLCLIRDADVKLAEEDRKYINDALESFGECFNASKTEC